MRKLSSRDWVGERVSTERTGLTSYALISHNSLQCLKSKGGDLTQVRICGPSWQQGGLLSKTQKKVHDLLEFSSSDRTRIKLCFILLRIVLFWYIVKYDCYSSLSRSALPLGWSQINAGEPSPINIEVTWISPGCVYVFWLHLLDQWHQLGCWWSQK